MLIKVRHPEAAWEPSSIAGTSAVLSDLSAFSVTGEREPAQQSAAAGAVAAAAGGAALTSGATE